MKPESQPQNIERLLAKAQQVDKSISRVTDLIVEPGGNIWPNNLQLANSSGAEYLRRAAVVGKETEILNEDARPMLERLKRETDEQINTIPAVKDLNAIRELVQREVLPKSVLIKAEEEFERLKKEPPSFIQETPREAPKPTPVILQPDQQEKRVGQTKEMLEIPGLSPIEKKPLYTYRDFAELIGKDGHYASSVITRIKNRDTRIQGKEERVGNTRTILYTKQELLWLAEDYAARPKRSRRSISPTAQDQALPEPEKEKEVADVKIAQETSIAPVQDTLNFEINGKGIAVPKKEFYTNEDIAVAIGRDKPYVRQAVQRAKINNTTIAAEYLKTNYGEILKFDEENFIKIVTDIMSIMRQPYKRRQTQAPPELGNNSQNETTVVPQAADLVPREANDYPTRERSRRRPPARLEAITLPDEKTVVNLPSRQVPILKSLIDAGEQGLSNDEITDIFYTGITKPHKASSVGNIALTNVKRSLTGSGYKIDNLTRRIDYAKGLKARYVFIEDPTADKPPVENGDPNITTIDAEYTPIAPKPQRISPDPMPTIIAAESPGAQIVEEETIFAAETPKPGDAVVLEKEEALVETPVPTLEISNEGYLILDGIPLKDLDEIEKAILTLVSERSRQGKTTSVDDLKDYIESGLRKIAERQVHAKKNTLNDKLQQADCIIVNTAPITGKTKAAFILKKGSLEDEEQEPKFKKPKITNSSPDLQVLPEEQTIFPEDQPLIADDQATEENVLTTSLIEEAEEVVLDETARDALKDMSLDASQKAKGLRTDDLERIKQQVSTDLALTISSHFASNNLGNVTTRPDSLLAPLLPPETTLEELAGGGFRRQIDGFFVDSLVAKLEGLQDTKDPKSLSVKERQILENLRVANRDLKTVIQTVCRHFLVPIPNKYA